MIFGLSAVPVATAILLATFLLVISDRFDRSLIALLGAGAMLICGVLTQDEAIKGIDFNTIALLAGMMVLVSIARRSGIFEFLAIWSAQRVRASPAGALCLLTVVTALVSSLLNNVTTVLMIAPVTLSITSRLRIAPFPFLFSEVLACNIGGAATLIGDPPNIMIGSAAGLNFDAFIIHLTPVIIIVLACQALAVHLVWGRKIGATAEARAEIMALSARAAIIDRELLTLSLAVLAGAVLAFVSAPALRLEPGSIALISAAILMLLDNLAHHRNEQTAKIIGVYADIDWTTIFFFVGLFVVVHGFEATGALHAVAHWLIGAVHGNLALAVAAILWASAILSAFTDNIPFVAAMIPLIKLLAPELGGAEALMPLWWALSLGACLGGNGTLIGASANFTVAGIAERNKIRFDFWTYTKYGAPFALMSIVICQLYLWLRYF